MNRKVDDLVKRFRQIGLERIYGLPVYNEALTVEAVDFRACDGGMIGALVTPWFLNIMLLPDDTSNLQNRQLGEKVKFTLETGEHDFVIGEDEEIGYYLFRTVTSPTQCYKKQVAAVTSGKKALRTLLTPPEQEQEMPVNSQAVEFTAKADEENHDQARRKFLRSFVPS